MMNLVHETLLSIMVSILHWVEFVQQRWFAMRGRGVVGCSVLSSSCSGTASSGVVIGSGSMSYVDVWSGVSVSITVECLVNVLRLTFELVNVLVTTAQDTTTLLELTNVDWWEGRGCVVLSSLVVCLMNRDCGMCDVWFDCLLVDDWLNLFMNMVMGMFTDNIWYTGGSCTCGSCSDRFISELASLVL